MLCIAGSGQIRERGAPSICKQQKTRWHNLAIFGTIHGLYTGFTKKSDLCRKGFQSRLSTFSTTSKSPYFHHVRSLHRTEAVVKPNPTLAANPSPITLQPLGIRSCSFSRDIIPPTSGMSHAVHNHRLCVSVMFQVPQPHNICLVLMSTSSETRGRVLLPLSA
jgi:hypothetical protein